jgi:rubrerythrin
MAIEFSGNEVIEMAIQIEKKGFEFYSYLAKNAKKDKIKELFNWLANEEQKHIAIFEDLRNIFSKIDTTSPYNWEEVALYFRALVDTQVFPKTDDEDSLKNEFHNEIGAIHIAISFEKDNILYFQEIKDLVEMKEMKIIDQLIKEEKKHIMKLLDVKKEFLYS